MRMAVVQMSLSIGGLSWLYARLPSRQLFTAR